MGETKNAYQILEEKHFGGPGRRLTRVSDKQEPEGGTELNQDRVHWRNFAQAVTFVTCKLEVTGLNLSTYRLSGAMFSVVFLSSSRHIQG
jgi:hypothetical protein